MKLSFDPNCVDYIGSSYLKEYKEAGLMRTVQLDEALQKRDAIKKYDLFCVQHWTSRFEDFIFEQEDEIDEKDGQPTKRAQEYMLVTDGILYTNDRYISNKDFHKVHDILEKFNPELMPYLVDFTLMVIYAKNNCFRRKDDHAQRLKAVIDYKQQAQIRNFFGSIDLGVMTKSSIEGSEKEIYKREYPDIKKITVSYEFEGEKRTLKINTPLLMRMMLYEFAQEYYQFVEHEDTEHWQVEVAKYISKPKKGNPKSSDAKNIKALIKAYLDFTIREGIFKEDDADLTKYLLIGQLLTVAGLEEYVEFDLKNKKKHGGYINEKDFYHKRIASRLEQ